MDKFKFFGINSISIITPREKRYIALGWIFAGLTAFVSPLFAIPGIIFGLLANKGSKGIPIILTNIFFALLNIFYGFLLFASIVKLVWF